MNDEQTAALRAVQEGKNIFLTGAGGTGKSYTINEIVHWSRQQDKLVAVTAMTGCAALLINAKTLHSWAGIGLGHASPSDLAAAILKKSRSKRLWLDTSILIIDEVSMMTPDLLEKLDLVGRRVRKSDKPFGGLQLILSGDFCQLPPVSTTRFAFESPVWAELGLELHQLTKIERQRDPVFQQILTEARFGQLSPASIETLKSRTGLDWKNPADGIMPTLIYSRNADVDKINDANMSALEGVEKVFEAQTVFKQMSRITPDVQHALDKLDQDGPYETTLTLKVGAQVMMTSNSKDGLVNGSRGVVTGFSPSGLPMVKFKTASIIVDRVSWFLSDAPIGRSQIPLKIAYAITIHKSQGSSLDSALIDIGSSIFEYGQAYVALSRVRTLEGLYIHRLRPEGILCHPKVRGFYIMSTY